MARVYLDTCVVIYLIQGPGVSSAPDSKAERHVDVRRLVANVRRNRLVLKAQGFVEADGLDERCVRRELDLGSARIAREREDALRELPAETTALRHRGDSQLG